MLSFTRTRTQQRSNRSMSLGGMDCVDPKKSNIVGKILIAATLTAMCILMLKQSPSFNSPSQFSRHEPGVAHVLVTGGAGYIGSHATLRLLKDSYRVTVVDNLSRGNIGAIKVLQQLFPEPGRLQFIYADLGDAKAVHKFFSENAFDAVMHFAAVAYVGESTLDPLKLITSKDHASVQINVGHLDETGRYTGQFSTFALCGFVRAQHQHQHQLNRHNQIHRRHQTYQKNHHQNTTIDCTTSHPQCTTITSKHYQPQNHYHTQKHHNHSFIAASTPKKSATHIRAQILFQHHGTHSTHTRNFANTTASNRTTHLTLSISSTTTRISTHTIDFDSCSKSGTDAQIARSGTEAVTNFEVSGAQISTAAANQDQGSGAQIAHKSGERLSDFTYVAGCEGGALQQLCRCSILRCLRR
ncbi:UDP-arabinose 4-epimerase 1, partial [Olea europaea subsp. europaea]